MTKKQYVHLAIMIALTVLIGICPPFGAITQTGMRTIGVFVGVLYGWMTIDLIWPSLFGYAALAIFGITDTTSALSSGFGNSQLVQVLVVMVMAGALDSVGVTKMLANWMVTRKLFRKSPWALVCGLIFGSYILGVFGAAIAGIMLLWGIVTQIAEEGHFKQSDPLVTFMIMMITAANFAGMFSLPFHATAMMFVGYFIDTTGANFATAPFIAVAAVTSLVVLTIMILLARFVFRIDASKFIMPEETIKKIEQEKAEKPAKIGFVVLLVYMAALILPSTFENMPGAGILNMLDIGGCSIVAMIVLAAISVKGKPMFSLVKTWTGYVEWPLILLLSVTFPIAEAIRADDAGIMPTVAGVVIPIASKMGLFAFMVMIVIVLGILTQFTHNLVLAALFIPFLIPLCDQLGGNSFTFFMLIFFTLNASFMTPAASFQSAMVHAHKGTNVKWNYIFGIGYSVVTWIILIVITLPLGNMMF
ncbi:MAG: SLC13 family permease [Peptococcaceae bacterium]|nr:SLC13 family permease [Peptococcaceae bacterium]